MAVMLLLPSCLRLTFIISAFMLFLRADQTSGYLEILQQLHMVFASVPAFVFPWKALRPDVSPAVCGLNPQLPLQPAFTVSGRTAASAPSLQSSSTNNDALSASTCILVLTLQSPKQSKWCWLAFISQLSATIGEMGGCGGAVTGPLCSASGLTVITGLLNKQTFVATVEEAGLFFQPLTVFEADMQQTLAFTVL